jgi:hypothetical protein
MANTNPITLQQLFRHWRALPHQSAAVVELDADLAANGPAVAMRRDRPWFATWSQDGKQPEPPLAPPAKPPAARPTNPLSGFPYFSQLNPADGPEAWRQCQASAIAMCLAYLKVPGIRDDTDYMRVVRRHGDTTVQETHRKALAELGVRARFTLECTAAQAQAEIRAGLPVAMGYLHRGPVGSPSGGGHWLACFGFDAVGWKVMDPYGNLDLVNGGWLQKGGSSGKDLRYSYRNFNPRWLVENAASGYAWLFS